MKTFDRDQILDLLVELCDDLAKQGHGSKIYIFGGAAVTLAYNHERKATTDIDVIFAHPEITVQTVKRIALKYDLTEKWINQEAANLVPFDHQFHWNEFQTIGGIALYIANPQMLLAMKLKSDRGGRDRMDTIPLLEICALTSLTECDDLFEKFWPGDMMKNETRAFLKEYFHKSESE